MTGSTAACTGDVEVWWPPPIARAAVRPDNSGVRDSSHRLKVQAAGISPPLTGGLSSTADFAAASRGKNLCFVIRQAQRVRT